MPPELAVAPAPDAAHLMEPLCAVLERPRSVAPGTPLRVGLDLGTANTVLVVLDEDREPLAAVAESGSFVRDGVVVDFAGATQAARRLKGRAEQVLGVTLTEAMGAIPPGVPDSDARAVRYVLESAELECVGLVDEPTAANAVLEVTDGVVVDVGGGSTGVAVIESGAVVHTADEPTGGTHFSLVVAGALGISVEEAERVKRDPARQRELLPVVTPVMERVASIVAGQVRPYADRPIWLVGGPAMFPGFAGVLTRFTGLPAYVPAHPLFITPLGIARSAPAHT